MAGVPTFFGLNRNDIRGSTAPAEPPKVLGQAFSPDLLKDVPAELSRDFIPAVTRVGLSGMSGTSDKDTYRVKPEYEQYAVKNPYMGMSGLGGQGQTRYYEIPTGKTYQDKPLVARYDTQGNFQFVTFPEDQYLRIDPSNPAVISQPKINKSGEIIDYGIIVQGDFGGSGLGGFISDFASDFGPMILAGLGANYFAGSGLLGGAGAAAPAATGGTLAGMGTGAAGAATTATITGTPLAALTAGGATPAGLLSGGGSSGGLAGFGTGAAGVNATAAATGLTPAALGVTGLTSAIPTPNVPTPTPSATTPPAGSGSPMSGVTPPVVPPVVPSVVDSSVLSAISSATGISVDTLKTFAPSVIQGLLSAGGSYLQSEQAKEAAQTQADAQIRAAQITADAARFRPVGVTTRFGSSNFQTDAAGNVIGAGYTPSAEITGYQDRLRTLAGRGLTQAEQAPTAYAPLTGAAQSLFSLGQGYLKKTPEEVAADYISKQQALLAPSQENQLAMLQNKLFQQGRTGAATAQGGNLMATSPEMAAYYNSLAQSNLVLAAQADQEAQNRIKFGAGLFDTGAGLQGKYYAGQTAAYSPFTTAMDTSSGLEQLAQRPLTLGMDIGGRVTSASADVGRLTGQGIINAASTMAPANAYSLGGNVLAGVANSPNVTSALNRAFGVTPQPTQQQYTFNPVTGQYVPVQQSVFAT